MLTWWSLVRFLHVLSAIVWVGGQLTLSVVARRAAAKTLSEEARAAFFGAAGRRFALIANVGVIPTLLATGLALAHRRGVTLGLLAQPGYGATLTAKVALALISFLLAAVHGVVVSRSERPGAARAMGVAAGLVSVGVVLLATALVP